MIFSGRSAGDIGNQKALKRVANEHHKVAGAIIAGGYSSRYGSNKAEQLLNGKALIRHVYDRLVVQVDELILNAPERYPQLPADVTWVPDQIARRDGPLIGVLSIMQALDKRSCADRPEWLMIAPCDTPFIPNTLVDQLLQTALQQGSDWVIPVDETGRHPTLSLWSMRLFKPLSDLVLIQKQSGFKPVFDELKPTLHYCGAHHGKVSAFFNINRGEDMAALATLLSTDWEL